MACKLSHPALPTDWDPVADLALALARENGVTHSAIAAVLGTTKSACTGRWRRLNANVSRRTWDRLTKKPKRVQPTTSIEG